MHAVLHLLRWQIRQHRALLLINSVVLAILLISPLVITTEALNSTTLIGKLLAFVTVCLLLGNMIHTQPYIGSESFWMTRPVARRTLLGAQSLLLLVFIFVPSLIGMLAITLHLDGEATHYIGTLLTWGIYMGLLYFIFAVAVTAPNPFATIVILVLVTGISAFTTISLENHASRSRRPNPDLLVILVPLLGTVSLALISVFIRKLSLARFLIICLAASIIPLQTRIQAFRLEGLEADSMANAPQIELRTEPIPDADLSETSYFYPIQITSTDDDKITIPLGLSLTDDTGLYIRKNFLTNNTLIHPMFTDKIIAAFPDAEEIVATNNILPFMLNLGNEFKDSQGKPVGSVSIGEGTMVRLTVQDYSFKHIGGIPLGEGEVRSESGVKVSIRSLIQVDRNLRINYNIQTLISKDINARQNESVYPAFYDTKTKRLTVQLSSVDRLYHYPSSLVSTGKDTSFHFPSDLITSDTELHFFLIEKLSHYNIEPDIQLGTYHSELTQPRRNR